MTTTTTFSPSGVASPPFQFQATLTSQPPNGAAAVTAVYNVTTTANLFGARWYVNVLALDGTLIGSRALVGSDAGKQLAALAWVLGTVTATFQAPHGYKIGRPVMLTISGATPAGYNGLFLCLPTSPTTLTYSLATNPGTATAFGAASYDVNLIGGLADEAGNPFTSSIVYRAPANQFEVSP